MLCCASKGSCRLIAVAAVVAGAAGFIVGSSTPGATAQNSRDDQASAMEGMPPGMEEAIARWAKHSAVTEHHKELHEGEGSWIVQSKWWWGPDAPPEEHTMMAQARPIMGGRFMLEEMSGLMEMAPGQMMPWEGTAITGYDNQKEKYLFIWFDNGTTSMTMGYGDKTGRNEWTFEYEQYDPMEGRTVERKHVITKKGENENVFDMYTKQADGSWFKNMQMTYLRAP